MSSYILGIDAGGTKTHGSLADEKGNIVSMVAGGGANWERYGIKAAQETIAELITELLSWASVESTSVKSATLALAGVDWPQDLALFNGFVPTLNFGGPTSIINDSFGALYAGAPGGVGCVSIAGTGGKTAGCDGKSSIQTMGMELGEGGGGGQLISLAVEKVAENYHQSAEQSPLAELLMRDTGISSLVDFFYEIARNDLRMNENLSPEIFSLAQAGDTDSAQIVAKVGRQHALDIISITSRLEFIEPVIVVQAGGLHTAGNAIFDEAFDSVLAQADIEFKASRLAISPSYGSVIHASHALFGGPNELFNQQLLEQARKRENQ
jgi:N-acetylglucosamine kinase-like BadF-type ATPase